MKINDGGEQRHHACLAGGGTLSSRSTNRRCQMYSIVGIVILVFDIIAILDCVKSNKEAGQKLLWVLLILILPLVGLILYYLVGKGKSA
jgi:hypothetical protein